MSNNRPPGAAKTQIRRRATSMAPPPKERSNAAYVPLRRRRESYDVELQSLERTYAYARSGSPALQRVLESLLWTPTWYVGNGGTMAVAQYAAELHNERTGRPATATTSLGFATSRVAGGSAVVIISAGAKHPDTAATVRAALDRNLARVVLVTERNRSELTGAFASPQVEVISIPRPGPRDGFLATNSVLSMATAFAAAYSLQLPETLPAFTTRPEMALRPSDDLVILSSVGTWSAATDLETRLVETGLATVQKTDFRNFAHGRHLGLSRMAGHVSVIAMSDARTKTLADATLALLPHDIPVLHLNSDVVYPIANLDLLVRSMQLTGLVSDSAGFDPARPEVPSFGRQLYRLESRRHIPSSPGASNVIGKVEAASLPVTRATLLDFDRRRKSWLRHLTGAPIASVLVDYDGTVCTTEGRFDSPAEPVRSAFLRLLQQGVPVGFVSGRGKSLPSSLDEWIPRSLQNKVVVGLYNGAIRGSLDDRGALVADLEGPFTQTAKGRRIVRELQRIAGRYGGRVDERPFQVSVEPHPSSTSLWPAFTTAVDELIARGNASEPAFKAVRSAHSIDVIPATSSKNLVRKDLSRLQGTLGRTLAIGDRGGVGGNDFELLAFDAFTLSVDEVSGDPSRCWNLAADGRGGPELLTRYLLAIKADRRRIHTFRWSID